MNFEEQPDSQEQDSYDGGTDQTNEAESQEDQLLDLDSVEKFRYGGVEYTPKELRNAMLRQEDYTRKTQSLAEERKYAENFAYDAAAVMKDPRLMDEFAKIYPEKYVNALKANIKQENPSHAQAGDSNSALPPDILNEINDLKRFRDEYQQRTFEAETASKEAEIDTVMKEFDSKYPLAATAHDALLSQAQMVFRQTGQLDKGTWEKIYKAVNSRMEKAYNDYHKSKFNKQREASSLGREVPDGGGVTGPSPRKLSNFADARKAFEEGLAGKGFR